MLRIWLMISLITVAASHPFAPGEPPFAPGRLPVAKLLPLEGQPFPAQAFKTKFQVYIFLSPECPLCQGYTVTLNKLQNTYGAQVSVIGIFPGTSYSDSVYGYFQKKYAVNFPLLKDPARGVTLALKATTTPEAFLVDTTGTVYYSGGIDDKVLSLGKARLQATRFYLGDAIQDVLARRPVAYPHEKAVGCLINDY